MEKGFVKENQVFLGQDFATREEAIAFLSKQAVLLGMASDEQAVYDAFMFREEEAETGMVEGFAVPHAKSDVIGRAGVIVVKWKTPVPWPSFDQSDVDIAIALLVPAKEGGTTHLRLLSKCAVMLMSDEFRATVRALEDRGAIVDVINAGLEKED